MSQKGSKVRKAKASTLVESIVALLILSIGVGMGMITYLNVIRADRADLKFRIKIAASGLVSKIVADGFWMDEEVTGKGYTLNKTVVLYNNTEGLYLVSVKATGAGGELLYSERTIIYHP